MIQKYIFIYGKIYLADKIMNEKISIPINPELLYKLDSENGLSPHSNYIESKLQGAGCKLNITQQGREQ